MILKVTRDNIADAGRVYCQSWREAHRAVCGDAFLEMHDEEYQTRYLVDKVQDGWELFIHDTGDNADGIIGLHRATGEIGLLYVLPSEWHKGHGRELLRFAVERMSRYKQPYLTVLNTNRRAIRIYEAFGFRYSGEQRVLSEEKGIGEMKYSYTGSQIEV